MVDEAVELGIKETATVNPEDLSVVLRQLNSAYRADIVDTLSRHRSGNEAAIEDSLDSWISHYDTDFRTSVNLLALNEKVSLAERNKIKTEVDNAAHDLMVVPPNFLCAGLEGVDGFERFLDPFVVSHPIKVIERLARQVEGKPVNETFPPSDVLTDVVRFFRAYTSNVPGVNINYKNESNGDLAAIFGDRLDFYAAIFNVVRNSQKRISKGIGWNITITSRNTEKGFKIIINDDAGGFPCEANGSPGNKNLLRKVMIKNHKGRKVKTQAAFVRGISGSQEGSGLGLDITRKVIEDDLGGKIKIRNKVFGSSGKMGASTIISIPKHNKP